MIHLTNEYIQLIKLQRPYLTGLSNDEIFASYISDVEQDYNDIKYYLRNTQKLVDIGAGMGGIDFLVKTNLPTINVILLDGANVVKGEHYGYRDNIAFYSNNQIAKDFFITNNVDAEFYTADASLKIECDTLISLNSWGFHYPLEQYRLFLENNSNTINTIIVDTRIRYQKLDLLEEFGFNYQKVLRKWGDKKQRMVFSKQPIDAYEPNNAQIEDLQNSNGTGLTS